MFAVITAASAQEENYKPEGSFGVEVAIMPLMGVVGFQQGLEYDNNSAGQLKVSYFLNDRMAVRLGLGFETASAKTDNGESGAALRKTENSRKNFSILPAFIYSFEGTARLAPYVGVEFAFGNCSAESISEVGTASGVIKTTTTNSGNMFNTFGISALTGFNYFFAKNLYIGVEAGVGFDSQKFKNEKVTRTGDPGWTAPAESKSSRENSTFGFKVNPILRLGWSF